MYATLLRLPQELEGPQPNPNVATIRLTLWQMAALGVRALAFSVAVAIHWLIDQFLMPLAIPKEWPLVRELLHVVFAAAFALVYLQQAWDIVLIFVPYLRPRGLRLAVAEEVSADSEVQ